MEIGGLLGKGSWVFHSIRILGLAAVFTAALAIHSRSAQANNQVAMCGLGQCWGDLFKEVRNFAADNMIIVERAIAEYEESAKKYIRLDPEAARKPFYELARYRACVRECESLAQLTRDGGSIDLMVIGKHYDANGKLFDEAAEGYYAEKLKARCGRLTGEEFVSCEKRIVILREPGREKFFSFLGLVRPGSIDSFTYVGHGLKDQIIFGERTTTRPASPTTSMTRSQWAETNDGALYSSDLAEDSRFSKALRRVFKPQSDIRFYACKTGEQFAGVFANAAGVKSAKGSLGPMSFRVQRADGSVERQTSRVIRGLKPGERYVLQSDKPGGFIDAKAAPYSPGFVESLDDKLAGDGKVHFFLESRARLSTEEVRKTILSPLAAGSASAVELDDSQVIHFSLQERREIRAASSRNKSPEQALLALQGSNPELKEKLDYIISETEKKLQAEEGARAYRRELNKVNFSLLGHSVNLEPASEKQ